jgi:hypothetical protein
MLLANTGTTQGTMGAGDNMFIAQKIEGWRISRLGWGTSGAQSITIGFWSAHVTTGLYSGVVCNDPNVRSYAFTYTQAVSSAPEYHTVTIPGDTAGTWKDDNTSGMQVRFAVACGSTFTAPSANTWLAGNYIAAPGQVNGVAVGSTAFRITGVVVLPGIEAPSAARSALIMRPFDQELLTCQRYWHPVAMILSGYKNNGNNVQFNQQVAPQMRATPAITQISSSHTAVDGAISRGAGSNYVTCYFLAASSGGFIFNETLALDARL